MLPSKSGGNSGTKKQAPASLNVINETVYPPKEESKGVTITWNGDTTGLVNVMGYYFKVSDLTPTNEELIGGHLYVTRPSSVGGNVDIFIQETGVGENNGVRYIDALGDAGVVICDTPTDVCPEIGTYFLYASPSTYVSGLSYGGD